ncbi:MAG: hypothetical protein IPK82_34850 [Polyangiaceae bacterium]|nr:hypothetical protein [Polyangiaceae bacterium]
MPPFNPYLDKSGLDYFENDVALKKTHLEDGEMAAADAAHEAEVSDDTAARTGQRHWPRRSRAYCSSPASLGRSERLSRVSFSDYFADAERDVALPLGLTVGHWTDVKAFFEREVPQAFDRFRS